MSTTIKENIYDYIISRYQPTDPIIQTYIYNSFKNIKPITIRQSLIRLAEDEKIIKSDSISGLYFLPNANRVLKTHTFNFSKYIELKYLKDINNEIVGYETGFTIANRLRLTSQTPSVSYICTNKAANKKRRITINNRRFIITAPRVVVTSKNYKLLQILDIIANFKIYSEYSIDKALLIFKDYLKDLSLNKDDIEKILNNYPITTQLAFFKMRVDYVIASL